MIHRVCHDLKILVIVLDSSHRSMPIDTRALQSRLVFDVIILKSRLSRLRALINRGEISVEISEASDLFNSLLTKPYLDFFF